MCLYEVSVNDSPPYDLERIAGYLFNEIRTHSTLKIVILFGFIHLRINTFPFSYIANKDWADDVTKEAFTSV